MPDYTKVYKYDENRGWIVYNNNHQSDSYTVCEYVIDRNSHLIHILDINQQGTSMINRIDFNLVTYILSQNGIELDDYSAVIYTDRDFLANNDIYTFIRKYIQPGEFVGAEPTEELDEFAERIYKGEVRNPL